MSADGDPSKMSGLTPENSETKTRERAGSGSSERTRLLPSTENNGTSTLPSGRSKSISSPDPNVPPGSPSTKSPVSGEKAASTKSPVSGEKTASSKSPVSGEKAASTKSPVSGEKTFKVKEIVSVVKEPTLGFPEAISNIYGNIIGSGIFITVSETFNVFSSNSIGMVLVFWSIGALIAMFGAMCYTELSTRYPQTGGDCVYYRVALNSQTSTTFAVMYAHVLRAITVAALATTSSKYLIQTVPMPESQVALAIKLLAVALILLCYVVNCISAVLATKAGVWFSVLKSLLLFIIIFLGVYFFFTGGMTQWQRPFVVEGFDLVNMALAMINVCWSFEGWNNLSQVAGEVKNPAKILPFATIFGVTLVGIMYLLTISSYFTVLGFDTIRATETIAVIFSRRTLGKAHFIIPTLISISALGSINGALYAASHSSRSSGCRRELPRVFSLVTKGGRTPVVSLTVIALTAMVFIPFRFQILLQYCAFLTWFFYFLSFICLLRMKFCSKFQSATEGGFFKVPSILVILMMCVCLFMIGMTFYLSVIGCSVIGGFTLMVFLSQYIPVSAGMSALSTKSGDGLIHWLERTFGLEMSLDETCQKDADADTTSVTKMTT